MSIVNLINFKNICQSGCHINYTISCVGYLYMTYLIHGLKHVLEKLATLLFGLYSTIITFIEVCTIMTHKFFDLKTSVLWHDQLHH